MAGTCTRVENHARGQRRQVEALQQHLPHLALQYGGGIVGRGSAIEGTPHPADIEPVCGARHSLQELVVEQDADEHRHAEVVVVEEGPEAGARSRARINHR